MHGIAKYVPKTLRGQLRMSLAYNSAIVDMLLEITEGPDIPVEAEMAEICFADAASPDFLGGAFRRSSISSIRPVSTSKQSDAVVAKPVAERPTVCTRARTRKKIDSIECIKSSKRITGGIKTFKGINKRRTDHDVNIKCMVASALETSDEYTFGPSTPMMICTPVSMFYEASPVKNL